MSNPVAQPPYGSQTPQYGAEPVGAVPADVEPPKKKSRGIAKRLGGIAVAIIVALGWFGVKSYLNRDQTADAKVGDCIATDAAVGDTAKETDATMATCGSAEATYSVVGRVEGESSLDSQSCEKYFIDEKVEYAIVSSDDYLLCVKKV